MLMFGCGGPCDYPIAGASLKSAPGSANWIQAMTIPPTEIDVREEIDILSVDPLFIERQRNRYASRAVAYVVWLNGLAALALLLGFAHATIPPDNVKRFADPMLVFGAGTVAGLGSAFFAYVGRTFRIERPYLASWRRPLRWLAILAAVAGAVCFIGALNMVRVAVLPKEAPAAASTAAPQPEKPTPSTPNP
jgi:hypothetical protein